MEQNQKHVYKYVEHVNVPAWATHLEFGVIVHENGDDSNVGNEPGEVKKPVRNIIYA